MDLSEFFAAYDGWLRLEESRERANLERIRWLGCVMLSPYSDKPISPQELMPLPGECVADTISDEDYEARRQAALKLLKEVGNVKEVSLAKD